MSLAPMSTRNKNYHQRLSFRHYSRQVLSQPANIDMHTSRLMVALELTEREPLQGALADMFYGCWYDVPFFGQRILSQVKENLSPQTIEVLERCIEKGDYISTVNLLATRWSVLVTPSMQVADHLLLTSADDSKMLAETTVMDLLDTLEEEENNYQSPDVAAIEDEFFAHCIACHDKLAFSLVWWQLSKSFWHFDARWLACQQQLNELTQVKANPIASTVSEASDVAVNQDHATV